jgi:hypothetical protein
MEEEEDYKTRKSLALDVRTYNRLQEICNHHERSKIGQLKVLIEKEHRSIFKEQMEKFTWAMSLTMMLMEP